MMRPPKNGKSHKGRPDAGPQQGRRSSPPPERTSLEPAYLGALEESKDEIVICLRDGERLRGRIETFDREVIVLRLAEGRADTVRKSEIRYVEEIDPHA